MASAAVCTIETTPCITNPKNTLVLKFLELGSVDILL